MNMLIPDNPGPSGRDDNPAGSVHGEWDYGDYFNSDKPTLHDDARMVVLELGGLESRPSLLIAVMFSLIIYIENRMYQSPRGLKKLNVIDEGWKLLDFKNEKVGQFIEKGYRTARRHTGAYITITQNIVDFDSPTASSAARAAWGTRRTRPF